MAIAYLSLGSNVGNRAAKVLAPERTQKIAAVVFAVLGALLVAGVL